MNKVNLISYHFGENGIGKYGQALHESLTKLKGRQSVHRIWFDFASKRIVRTVSDSTIIKQSYKIPLIDNYLLFGIRNRSAIPRENESINHILSQTLSFLKVSPKVITCHDIIPFKISQGATDRIEQLKYHGLREADAVIAISEHTKKDLIDFGVDEKKIHRIYHGVKKRIVSIPEAAISLKYNFPTGKRLILSVGTEKPRKNFTRLLQAFARAREYVGDAHIVKVGDAGGKKYRKRSLKTVKAMGLQNRITFTDHVSEDELTTIYDMADVLVFPSLYEGFGLPPLEAMASGTPVICSNISSLPEVVGSAGITVNPCDVDALAKAIIRVLGSDALQRKMKADGLEQAKQFSWEKCARETEKVYNKVLC